MLNHLGEQADRLIGGLIGATLGVVFSISPLAWSFSAKFLVAFFLLFFAQSVPRHRLRYDPNGGIRAFLFCLFFLALWVAATILFANVSFWEPGWTQAKIEPRIMLVLLLALLFASLVTIVPLSVSQWNGPATADGGEG
jgi:hypothetical protein